MRSPNRVLESLRSKACISDYSYERLYRNLYNPEFYLQAYQNIYATAGNMTKGTDGSTIDGMSIKRIDKLIASLKNYSYQPNPARRTYIPKNSDSTKKRPLGIPSFDDKLLQEVIRMILESIYEGTFSPRSHGFRPKRSCHTALLEVKTRFTGVKWFVEGDIRGCFDNVDHHVLVSLLRRRIKDEHFLGLIWKFLKAGYMENWVYHNTLSGTAQGSGASPILANIYLNELDKFMEQYAGQFNSGKKRLRSCEYNRYRGHLDYLRGRKYSKEKWESLSDEQKKQAQREIRETRAKMMSIDSTDQMDESYRRVVYIRYADDFLIGVIGSKRDAETLKTEVGSFLKDSLKLDLSADKTLVTNAKDTARFLSFDIYSNRSRDIKKDKNGMTRRVYNERIKLYVPKGKWMNKLIYYGAMKIHYDARNGNREVWKPFHRTHLFHNDDLEILQQYNAEIRGLYNYYKIADNVSVLSGFGYIMKYSMFKTFAAKYKTRIGAIKDKYRMGKDFGVKYETKSGSKVMLLYNEGFRHSDEAAAENVDAEPKVYANSSPNSLIARLKAKKCEWCGAENVDMDIHHVRKLKDLKGRKKWEKAMIARRRKTMALCEHCHVQLHAGNLD
ncbi:reverse transcriptase domain-containing protein [Paenibacillus glucanolyticus]|uniref:Reverse transcriptase domain-containing protein n=1 Tax=Paenibacillus provencensis TaxID=441151 RepID=A0ABW3PL76_9BACL|nr:reverse transcriptase/maturase family protein [Paenibacillus sp. p3-SID867]MCT1400890.1 reverse transcriptase domain-containing protein [Paenibacillus sp. p3-SID867]